MESRIVSMIMSILSSFRRSFVKITVVHLFVGWWGWGGTSIDNLATWYWLAVNFVNFIGLLLQSRRLECQLTFLLLLIELALLLGRKVVNMVAKILPLGSSNQTNRIIPHHLANRHPHHTGQNAYPNPRPRELKWPSKCYNPGCSKVIRLFQIRNQPSPNIQRLIVISPIPVLDVNDGKGENGKEGGQHVDYASDQHRADLYSEDTEQADKYGGAQEDQTNHRTSNCQVLHAWTQQKEKNKVYIIIFLFHFYNFSKK